MRQNRPYVKIYALVRGSVVEGLLRIDGNWGSFVELGANDNGQDEDILDEFMLIVCNLGRKL